MFAKCNVYVDSRGVTMPDTGIVYATGFFFSFFNNIIDAAFGSDSNNFFLIFELIYFIL